MCCNAMLYPGNLDLLSQTLGGPVVPLVCGFIRRDNLRRGARSLRTFTSENLAYDFGRNTSTLTEFIGYADSADCREISPEHSRHNDKQKCVGKS